MIFSLQLPHDFREHSDSHFPFKSLTSEATTKLPPNHCVLWTTLKLCISRITQCLPFCVSLLFVTQHLLDLFVLYVAFALQYPIMWTYAFFSSPLLLDVRLFPGFSYKENHGESCFTSISCVYGVGKACVMVYLRGSEDNLFLLPQGGFWERYLGHQPCWQVRAFTCGTILLPSQFMVI